MAWFAMYKWFAPWRKTKYINMIDMYKKKLFDDWFATLSIEEQKSYKDREKRRKEADKKHAMETLMFMGTTMDYIANKTGFDYRRLF